jgi:predicted DNA-binding transcriptional regulator YafY
MAAREDKYYLICNLDGKDDVANYRIDRITDIRLLDTKRRPFTQIKDSYGNSLNLGEYMKHHIYMFAGDNARVRFRAVKVMISDIIDIFGKDVIIEEESDTHIIVTVRVNEAAIIRFAQSFAPDVVILEPPELANKMKDWAKKVKKAYGG